MTRSEHQRRPDWDRLRRERAGAKTDIDTFAYLYWLRWQLMLDWVLALLTIPGARGWFDRMSLLDPLTAHWIDFLRRMGVA